MRTSNSNTVIQNGVAITVLQQILLLETENRKTLKKKKKTKSAKNTPGPVHCLKNGCSHQTQSELFCNQYETVDDDGKIVTKTLAMKDTKAHYNNINLQ